IWIGTEKMGVFRHDPTTDQFELYPASAFDALRFPPATIASIYEDPEGTMWFVCGQQGVVSVNRHLQKFKSFRHSFDSDNSLGFNRVSGLFEDSKGFIWIGTDGNGVDRFNPTTFEFTHFRHNPDDPETLASNAVLAIAEDSHGTIWLGTWAGGLNRLDPATGKVKRYLHDPAAKEGQSIAENHVMRIHIDNHDRLILAGVASGLQIFDPANGHFQAFTPNGKDASKGIQNYFINDIIPTADGSFWLGGYQTLERFSPATGYSLVPDLAINKGVLDLHQDKNGLLWIATNAGLYRFNPTRNEVIPFTAADGLRDDFIVGIEQDSLDYLWLATRNGLVRMEQTSRAIDTFDELDGLAGSDFNRFSHLTTRAGLMYFGTDKGISFFDPLHIPRNEYAPHIHFTQLQVNQQVQQLGKSPWLARAFDLTQQLTLPDWADDIKITFAATNLVMPAKNRYRYRLLGKSDEWIDATDQHSAQYSNLSPGQYRFQVIAANNDGVWTGTTRELIITILPAWWQTWWAYCLYAALFVASIQGFSMLRLHLSTQRRKTLEHLVNEQTGKLKEANRAISQLNSQLEQRVAQRTRDLQAEVEERKESEAKVTYIAYHDILSGLHNRAWLLHHLDSLLTAAHTNHDAPPFALLFIGGDRFRAINDTYGHQTGDKLLILAAEKLREICPHPMQLARLGSDEFAVVIDQLNERSFAQQLAETIVNAFKEPIALDQLRLTLNVSVGYVIAGERYIDATQVLRDANIAMQKAKDRGRGISQEFDAEMLQQMLDQTALEADLKLALSRNEFSVVFQPIMRLSSMKAAAFEILIRWQHPSRGMVPPDRFITMAESSGLIFDIGLWVLEQACQQLTLWKTTWPDQQLPIVAVNLSPIQLEREDFLTRIEQIFQRTQIDPHQIEFEITESALMRQTNTVTSTLHELRQRGIQLGIDDFGTGYSSLSYLDKLPVQILKIDRSFINALTQNNQINNNTSEIVRATIALAHNLKMSVVAEGVETAEQLALLQSYGCDYGQGYYFARPLLAQDATAKLAQNFVQ
ncbi:MAG TPA: EAL domain-containing protein, partial [Cellvibrionaceae bacterium]|nr:EAL domain-containing protein [Cellvibrionaceae bacterium]